MRQDNLANALRQVVCACGCQLALEPRLAVKKGVVEFQRRGDSVVEVDDVVAHAPAKSYAAPAAKTAGWTAARAEHTSRTHFSKDVPHHASLPVSAVCGGDVRVHGQGGGEVREPPWGQRS